MKFARALAFVLLPLVSAAACGGNSEAKAKTQTACAPAYRIVAEHPHDPAHFTQGLAVVEGHLFESTGRYGESAVYEKELRSGRVLRAVRLPESAFGEGLARAGAEIMVLTWREGTAFVYDLGLSPRRRLQYGGEGWGLSHWPTTSGERLVMSDGSDVLRVLRPFDFSEAGRIAVRENGTPLRDLNELEFVDGLLYANVWKQDRIVVIDPATGEVKRSLDLSGLRGRFAPPPGWQAHEDVLNGIAYDAASRNFFVTGKRWPVLFELELKVCR